MITFFYIVSGIVITIVFIVSLINFFSAPMINKNFTLNDEGKLVSILIPARNEERNITDCLISCLNQSYLNKEILVLNDNSSDRTAELLEHFSDNIKIINGSELPEGWLGKNWACHQLSQNAKGEYLLFIDADVRLDDNAVESAISEINISEAGMISVFPTQIIKSFSEWLIVPLMNWLLLGFLPLLLVYKSKHKSFVAANGQFILWEKNIYQLVGGHTAVKNKPVEDMEFARICKSKGIKIKTLLGNNITFCRMYSNFNEAVKGFSKNFFPGFNTNGISFLLFLLIISFASIFPFLIWDNILLSVLLIALIILSRIFISIKSNQNIFINLLLHPLQMLVVFAVGIISVYKTYSGKLEWKERKL
jgi:chlorobactene glucosyltransferase